MKRTDVTEILWRPVFRPKVFTLCLTRHRIMNFPHWKKFLWPCECRWTVVASRFVSTQYYLTRWHSCHLQQPCALDTSCPRSLWFSSSTSDDPQLVNIDCTGLGGHDLGGFKDCDICIRTDKHGQSIYGPSVTPLESPGCTPRFFSGSWWFQSHAWVLGPALHGHWQCGRMGHLPGPMLTSVHMGTCWLAESACHAHV